PGAMRRRVGVIVVAVPALLVLGLAGGWMISNWRETGRWEVPETEDLVRVIHPHGAPSRVIFLDGRPTTIAPGITDDARRLRSTIMAHRGTQAGRVPGWIGGADRWRRVVACVRALYAPFAVEVTDVEPTTDDQIRVLVGGRPADIGVTDRHVSGLAPFDG